jgi:hypothetical protein
MALAATIGAMLDEHTAGAIMLMPIGEREKVTVHWKLLPLLVHGSDDAARGTISSWDELTLVAKTSFHGRE